MPEIIACPRCQRRLRLPDGFHDQAVQCPSCQANFTGTDAYPAALSVMGAPPAAEGKAPARPATALKPSPLLKKPSGKKRLLCGLLAGAALVLGLGVLAFQSVGRPVLPPPAPPPVRAPMAAEDGRREVREAFANQPPADAEQIAKELKPLFDGLGAAFHARDGAAILAHYDVERMFDELTALGAPPPRDANGRRAFLEGMRKGLTGSLTAQAPALDWQSSEVRKVRKLGADEAAVLVRHLNAHGTPLKMRWWVTRRSGEWKVYDMESLDMGLRVSTMSAALLGRDAGDLAEIARAVKVLGEAAHDVRRNDPNAADAKLRQVERVQLPGSLETLRVLLVAVVQLHRGQAQECLNSLNRARQLPGEAPILDLLEGTALNRLGRPADALKHLQAYNDLLGDDASICLQLGECLRELRRFPDAARAYRKCLDFDPKNADAFLGLMHSLGVPEDKSDVGARFARLDDPRGHFTFYAEDCERRQFPGLLEPLATAMYKIDPAFAPANYYLSRCRARAGQADLAVPLFKSALAQQADAGLREAYAQGFLKDMATAGHYADAYEAAPDAGAAFRFLAAEAMKTYRSDDLELLTAAHAKKQPNDPLLPLYQAEVYVRQGLYPLAEKTFAAALAKPPDEETLKPFRASRVLARHYAGQDLSAYRDVPPRQDTFRQLAFLLLNEQKDAPLEALLEAHAANDPDDLDVACFRCRLKVRRGQTAEAVALFKALLAKPLPEDKRAEIVDNVLIEFMSAGKTVEGYRAAPDAKKAFALLTDEMFEDDSLDDLPALVAAHRERAPDDPWLAYYEGEVQLEKGVWDKAAVVLKEGMKTAPKDMRTSFRSKYVYALYKAGRGMQALAETDAPDETFTQLADLLAADKKGAELEALVNAYRPRAGSRPEPFYQEARAKALRKQPAAAAALLKEACDRQAVEAMRKVYIREVLLEMLGAGQALDGYRAVADKSTALEALAPELVRRKSEKDLAALLQDYGRDHAGEPIYEFYQGELSLLHGDANQAGPHFAAALAKGTIQERWRFTDGLFRARVKAGQAAAAYRESKPGKLTFESLAGLCKQAKDAGQLQALIAAHRQDRPDDPNLPAWDVEVLWLNQDYEGALKLLTARREDVFDLPRHRWQANDYRVRCLVKLKRTDEAVREAEGAAKNGGGAPLLLALAHAAAGDVRQATADAEKVRATPYLLRSWYHDADLGPLLQSEPFRPWREKYPQPKDEDAAAGADLDD